MNTFFTRATVVFIILLSTETAHAQGFYFQGNGGYGFGISRTLLGEKVGDDPMAVPQSAGGENVYGFLGRGVVAGLRAGYMITPVIGVELAGSYTDGAKTDQFRAQMPDPTWSGPRRTLEASIPAVSPSLVLSLADDGIVPYARGGLYIAFPEIISTDRKDVIFQISTRDSQKEAGYTYNTGGFMVALRDVNPTTIYTGGISVGVQFGVGVRMPFTDAISLTGEAWMVNASWEPERLEERDGTVLVKYSESEQSRPRFALSAAGISLGLLYRL